MTQWQPFKPTFMPIDCYQDDARLLNEKGRKFLNACGLIDIIILGVMEKNK